MSVLVSLNSGDIEKISVDKSLAGKIPEQISQGMIWYKMRDGKCCRSNWIQVKNWWFSISVMVSYPQFMNIAGVLGQRTLRINLGSKILTWLNSFVLLLTDNCIFALSLLIDHSATCSLYKAQDAVHSMFIMWSIFTATRP